MKTLWLTEQQAQQIVGYARDARPQEVCGLIGGKQGRAEFICPVPNSASDPVHYYEMQHDAMITAMFDIDRRGLELIGIYHSHPDGEAIPSPTDIAQAAYPDVAYLIVGLGSGGRPDFAAWRLRPYEVDRLTLHVGSLPPIDEPENLSDLQKAAIVIGMILAFVFMMVVSLSLLPPAPRIP